MTWKTWRRARVTIQILAFAFYISLIFAVVQRRVAPPLADIFFRFDPLSGLGAMLAHRAWIPNLALGLITVGITLIIGRVWCGWICPLGSLLEWIVESRQPLSFSDLDQRAEKLPLFPAGLLKLDYKSFLGIPLINNDKVTGVITLALRRTRSISAYQQHMLNIVANQVATSITNARLHQQMLMMATTDGLTGLVNHRHFQEKADEEFVRIGRYPEPLSLLLLDIDHFKKVNDTYGHHAGDLVLRHIAAVLAASVRDQVDLVGRLGGEEFGVLLPETTLPAAREVAERVLAQMRAHEFVIDGQRFRVTLSIGMAPGQAGSGEDALREADANLYRAKSSGRDRVCGPDAG